MQKKKDRTICAVRPAQRAIDNLGEKNLKLTCSVGPSFLKLPDSPELILRVFARPLSWAANCNNTLYPLQGPVLPGQRWIEPDLPRERRTAPKYFQTRNLAVQNETCVG